jgi:hypothetical protein
MSDAQVDMLNVVMKSAVIMSVAFLNVVMLNVIILNGVAPSLHMQQKTIQFGILV